MRASIVRRDHLDILVAPPSVRLLVLDAQIREMDLVVEVRQIVFVRPLANLVRRPIGVSVVVVVVLVAFVKPPLVLALQFVVEDDALDVRVALQEPRLGLLVGAIDLEVVFQFPLARHARIERLTGLLIAVTVVLEQVAPFPRQSHRLIPMAGEPDGLDQASVAEVAEVAGARLSWAPVVVSEVTTGDHSEGADGGERTRLRPAQRVLAVAVANQVALRSTRQIDVAREHVPNVPVASSIVAITVTPAGIPIPIASMSI